MRKPYWLSREECLALHEMMLSQYGGSEGLRDENMLESALAKPLQLFAYGKPTMFDLAASYVFGVVKNHPFIDGNMRVGFIVAVLFLELNSCHFQATEAEAVVRTLALAAGEMSEKEFAAWLKENSRRAYK